MKKKKLRKRLSALPKRIPDSMDLDMMAEAQCSEDDSLVPLEALTASLRECDGRLLLQIPRTLHETLAKAAKAEGVTLSQYALYKLARD